MSRLKAVRPFDVRQIGLIVRGSKTDSPVWEGYCPVQTIYEYIFSSLMLTATRAGIPVSALCHIRPNGAGWVAYGSFFNVSRGFDELFTTPLVYIMPNLRILHN
jgi:hypothetical protein